MKQHKFSNDTFNFDLTLIIFNNSEKQRKKVLKIAKGMGYSKKAIFDVLDGSNAVVFGKPFRAVVVFDSESFNNFKGKEKVIEILKTLQHECNHIKENILNDIWERPHRETECAMRISDWCFKKCMSVDFFTNLLK